MAPSSVLTWVPHTHGEYRAKAKFIAYFYFPLALSVRFTSMYAKKSFVETQMVLFISYRPYFLALMNSQQTQSGIVFFLVIELFHKIFEQANKITAIYYYSHGIFSSK